MVREPIYKVLKNNVAGYSYITHPETGHFVTFGGTFKQTKEQADSLNDAYYLGFDAGVNSVSVKTATTQPEYVNIMNAPPVIIETETPKLSRVSFK